MSEDVGEFKISMEDFMFVEMREPMNEFTENFDSLILGKISPFLDVVV